MARSKLSIVVFVFSVLVVAGCVVIFLWAQAGNSHLSATSYKLDDPAAFQPPSPIDPATVEYRQTGRIALDFKKVAALAVDCDDRVLVAGDKSLCRYSPQGQPEMRIALPYEPTALTVANRHHLAPGRIYVGFVDHLEAYSPDGRKAAIWQGLGDSARFTSISSSDQCVFIADAGQNVVQRFDWAGKLLEPIGESRPGHFTGISTGARASFDLSVGLDELVYVVNRREHRVEGYNFQGEMERHWGQGSPAVADFAGPASPAHLAITSDARFVTAEDDPIRIKVYSRWGDFEGVVCGPEGTDSVVALATDQHKRILVLDGKARCVRVFEKKQAATAKR